MVGAAVTKQTFNCHAKCRQLKSRRPRQEICWTRWRERKSCGALPIVNKLVKVAHIEKQTLS